MVQLFVWHSISVFRFDLLYFIVENVLSQTYLFPNIECIFSDIFPVYGWPETDFLTPMIALAISSIVFLMIILEGFLLLVLHRWSK